MLIDLPALPEYDMSDITCEDLFLPNIEEDYDIDGEYASKADADGLARDSGDSVAVGGGYATSVSLSDPESCMYASTSTSESDFDMFDSTTNDADPLKPVPIFDQPKMYSRSVISFDAYGSESEREITVHSPGRLLGTPRHSSGKYEYPFPDDTQSEDDSDCYSYSYFSPNGMALSSASTPSLSPPIAGVSSPPVQIPPSLPTPASDFFALGVSSLFMTTTTGPNTVHPVQINGKHLDSSSAALGSSMNFSVLLGAPMSQVSTEPASAPISAVGVNGVAPVHTNGTASRRSIRDTSITDTSAASSAAILNTQMQPATGPTTILTMTTRSMGTVSGLTLGGGSGGNTSTRPKTLRVNPTFADAPVPPGLRGRTTHSKTTSGSFRTSPTFTQAVIPNANASGTL